ncbi:transposase, partial [Geomonas propionica]|uniref:transposase n=1 Tax=Geomonas propionica TaxID=2798582 RepID=UPI001F3CE1E5
QVAELFTDPEARKIIEVDVAMIDSYCDVIGILEPEIEKTAQQHDRHALMLLRSIKGVGQIIALVLLYEIQDIHRFETVQRFASYARLVKCTHESAGKKKGTGGAKIGNPHLKWALSEAAVSFIQNNPRAGKFAENLARAHGKGKALAIVAHKLGRAI